MGAIDLQALEDIKDQVKDTPGAERAFEKLERTLQEIGDSDQLSKGQTQELKRDLDNVATLLLSTGYDSRMGQDGIDAAKDFGQFATGVLTEFSGSDKNFQKDFEDTQAQFGGTLLLMLQNLDSINDDDSIMNTIQGGAGARDIKMNIAQDVPVNNYSELDGNDPNTIPSIRDNAIPSAEQRVVLDERAEEWRKHVQQETAGEITPEDIQYDPSENIGGDTIPTDEQRAEWAKRAEEWRQHVEQETSSEVTPEDDIQYDPTKNIGGNTIPTDEQRAEWAERAEEWRQHVEQETSGHDLSELDGNDPRTIPSNGLVYQGWSADGFHESISPQGAAVGAVSVESSSISVKSVEGQDGVNLSVISVNGEDFTSLSDARFNGSASAQTFEEVVQTMNNEFESTVAAWDTEFESTVKEEFSSFKM